MIADGGYRGTGLIIPHRREPGQTELSAWKSVRVPSVPEQESLTISRLSNGSRHEAQRPTPPPAAVFRALARRMMPSVTPSMSKGWPGW